jgi:hypothetical protein
MSTSEKRHLLNTSGYVVYTSVCLSPIQSDAFKTKKGKLLPKAKKILELLFAKGASPDCYTSDKESTVIMY